jgi:hypothetical protein
MFPTLLISIKTVHRKEVHHAPWKLISCRSWFNKIHCRSIVHVCWVWSVLWPVKYGENTGVMSITEATFKCGQCDIAQFVVLRTISHNSSFIAHFRTINHLHNFMHKIQLYYYYFNLYSEFDLGRVDTVTRGELISWPGASWFHDLGRVDTGVTRGAWKLGELIPWPWARWYRDLGRIDTMTWGELIPHALRSWVGNHYVQFLYL